jgi:ankyrin repeat protein/predicted RNase H-like HicB family nuclease
LHNPQSYIFKQKDIYGFEQNKYQSLRNYTYKWDRAINSYLRSKKNDEEYLRDKEFLKYYLEYGDTPEEALENIKDAIKNIDESFIDSLFTDDELVVFRGTEDCILYDGLNLGFISTSISYEIAKRFSYNEEKSGCIYEMHISPGIPYIYMESLTITGQESEILLPRNLITILREKIGNKFIVDVILSREDQFIFNKDYKEYNISIINNDDEEEEENNNDDEENNDNKTLFNKCYKNRIQNGNVIDEITGNIIEDDSINNNGLCYNKSTLIKLFEKYIEDNKLLLDPFTQIQFSNEIIMDIILLVNNDYKDIIKYAAINNYLIIIKYYFEHYNTNKILFEICLSSASFNGNINIVKYLVENGVNINSTKVSILYRSVEGDHNDIFIYLMENGGNINFRINEILRCVIINNNLYIIKYIVEHTKYPLSKYEEIFILAAEKGYLDILEYFIKLGINDKKEDKEEEKLFIDDALIGVIKNEYGEINEDKIIEIVKYLIDNGANINAQNNLPLKGSTYMKSPGIFEYLIKLGAIIDDRDDFSLIYASEHGLLDIVKFLIKNGVDINKYGNKSLIEASKNGHIKIVEYLIKLGVDVNGNDNGEKSIIVASEKGYLDIVKILVENGANVNAQNGKALLYASKNGHLNVVKYLVENGFNIKGNKFILEAIKGNHYDIVKYLIEIDLYFDITSNIPIESQLSSLLLLALNKYNINMNIIKYLGKLIPNINGLYDKCLINAVNLDKLNSIKYFIENGANVNVNNGICLITAIKRKKLDVVKYLIKKGADINIDNDAPIKEAFKDFINNTIIIKYLIDNGADINIDNGQLLTSSSNDLIKVKSLIEFGADINVNNGKTLFYAVINDRFDVIQYLVENGIKFTEENNKILQHLLFNNKLDIAKYLIYYGMDINMDNGLLLFNEIERNNLKNVKFLIDNGINIHQYYDQALKIANDFNKKEIIDYLKNIL